jgi:hypothetical protein
MPDAGYETGTATNRTRCVPVRRMPGQMKLTNAGTMRDKSTSRLYVCLLIKIAQNAGCQFGNRQSRTGPQGVPVTRMQGPKNLINAGIIERMPDNKSTLKSMCMPDNKNGTKCRMPVWKPAQPPTGPGVCRLLECRVQKN